MDQLAAQAAQVKTERGRAWISARSPEQKLSFPAVVVIDRSDAERPRMRIEAMDPLGATHALMLLDESGRLTWVDYDERRIYEMRKSWHGLPLLKLPELLIGLATMPADGRVGAAGPDGFEVREGQNAYRFTMSWIDPGPRLSLAGIEGEVHNGHRVEHFHVSYGQYLDKDDFYLPRQAKLAGYVGAVTEKADVEVQVDWRERAWNEQIPSQVFALPPAARKFSKEQPE